MDNGNARTLFMRTARVNGFEERMAFIEISNAAVAETLSMTL
jgi:hypothetical protein